MAPTRLSLCTANNMIYECVAKFEQHVSPRVDRVVDNPVNSHNPPSPAALSPSAIVGLAIVSTNLQVMA